MKKKFILIPTIIIILLIFLIIITFPKHIYNAVFIDNENNYSHLIINGNRKYIKTGKLSFKKFSIINFKKNMIKSYSFKLSPSIDERVMSKHKDYYDMEISGSIKLSKVCYYYIIDKNNNISSVKSNKIIVGKNNVKSYKDGHGNLNTFMISKMDYKTMRVGISTTDFSSIYHKNASILCRQPVEIYGPGKSDKLSIKAGTQISIQKDGDELALKTSSSTKKYKRRIYIEGNIMTLKSVKRGKPAFNPSYSGVLEFTPEKSGLLIINEVPIEDYIEKVVPSEMPSFGGIESLKCQAVAARTYAISDMLANRFDYMGFYVNDSTQSQVYNNEPRNNLTNEAVFETQGIIMTYNGKPIDAKYYSASAGTGVTYKDVWKAADGSSENEPYFVTSSYIEDPNFTIPKSESDWLSFYKNTNLKGVDSTSPYFRWRIAYTKAGLTNSLKKTLPKVYKNYKKFMTIKKGNKVVKKLPDIGTIQDVKVLKRSEGGNVISISYLFDNNVEIILNGESTVRSSLRCGSDYTVEETHTINYKNSILRLGGLMPSSFFSFEKSGDNFTIYGGGYGHGVGMSQYGAMGLSKSGKEYKDILNTFYKNVKLEDTDSL